MHTRTHALRAPCLPRTLTASRPARSSAHPDAALGRPRPCPAPCGHTFAHGDASPCRPHSNAPPAAQQPQRLRVHADSQRARPRWPTPEPHPQTHLHPQAFPAGEAPLLFPITHSPTLSSQTFLPQGPPPASTGREGICQMEGGAGACGLLQGVWVEGGETPPSNTAPVLMCPEWGPWHHRQHLPACPLVGALLRAVPGPLL